MSKENLVMRIIMQANDKASAVFKNIQMAGNGLSGSLLKNKNELNALNATMRKADSFAHYQQQLRNTANEVDKHNGAIKKLTEQIKKNGQPTKQQISQMAQLEKKAQDLASKENNLKDKVASLGRELHKAGFNTKDFGNAQVKAKQQASDLTLKINSQRQSLDKLTNAEKKYQKAKDVQSKMRSAGATAMFTGGAGMAAGVGMMKSGYDFEKDFARVQALTRLDKEKDAQTIAMLRNQALDLGANTSFTAGQVAQGQGYLAMAGFNPDAIKQSMQGVLDMTKAAGMDNDLARVADISSDILSAFRKDASQMGNVADVLTATFTSTNTSLELMGESMKYVAPIATEAGVSFEQTAAMVGLLGNVGIKGSQAGTSLKAMLLNLSSTGQKAMANIGVAAKDAQGNLRPLTDIMIDIGQKTDQMGSADKLKTITSIFGKEAAPAVSEILRQTGVQGLQELTKSLENAQGTAAKTAGIMGDTLKGDIDNLLSAKEAISISLFDQNNGVMRSFVQDLTGMLRSVNAWVKANPKLAASMFKIVAVTTVLMTVLGGMAITLSMLIGPLALLRLSWVKLTLGMGSSMGIISKVFMLLKTGIMAVGRVFLMNPIGLAITAIIAALYLLWKYWDEVKSFMIGAWQAIDSAFASYPILNYIFPFIGIARTLINHWQAVVAFFASAWQSIQAFFGSGIGNISATIVNWSPLGLFHRVFAGVMSFFGVEIPAKMTNFGSMIVQGLINGLKSKFPALSGFWSSVTGMFNQKMRQANDIRSPSRVMAGLGRYIMQGLAVGIGQGKAVLANTYDKAIGVFQNPITTGGFLDRAVKTLLPEGNPMHPQLAGAMETSVGFGQASPSQSASFGGDTITIQVFANGHDVGSVRKQIEQFFNERDSKKQRARNSSFWDKD